LKMKELTAKQAKFVELYLISRNALESAKKAGYKHPEVNSSRLLKNDIIRHRIDKRISKTALRTDNILIDRQREAMDILEKAKSANDLRTALSANDQLIRLGGFYAPEKRVTLKTEITVDQAREYLLQVSKKQRAIQPVEYTEVKESN